MTTGSPEGRLRLREASMVWRLVEGEVVVLDLDNSDFLAVNRSGACLWGLLADGATHDQLVGVLVERYGVDPARAATDVQEFVESLDDRRLLEN
jgi:Coenzyme PQQ synthesis protein D (PqqD)